VIDSILADMLPDSFRVRTLPEAYGAHYLQLCPDSMCVSTHNVKYSSYVEGSRVEGLATTEDPPFLFFETGLLMVRKNFQGFVQQAYATSCHVVGMPCRLSKQAGLRRIFGHRHDGVLPCTISALTNASSDEADDLVGLLYPAPREWAQSPHSPPEEGTDIRASLYDSPHERVEITPEHLTVLKSWMRIPPSARIFAYVCKVPQPPSFEYPISQFVLDLILSECLDSHGEEFCQEYVDTTASWVLPDGATFWLNDRLLARRPWVHLGGRYKIFDRILFESTSQFIPNGILLKRRLFEEYASLAPEPLIADSAVAQRQVAAGPGFKAAQEKRSNVGT